MLDGLLLKGSRENSVSFPPLPQVIVLQQELSPPQEIVWLQEMRPSAM